VFLLPASGFYLYIFQPVEVCVILYSVYIVPQQVIIIISLLRPVRFRPEIINLSKSEGGGRCRTHGTYQAARAMQVIQGLSSSD
jgi:hypothetical protein